VIFLNVTLRAGYQVSLNCFWVNNRIIALRKQHSLAGKKYEIHRSRRKGEVLQGTFSKLYIFLYYKSYIEIYCLIYYKYVQMNFLLLVSSITISNVHVFPRIVAFRVNPPRCSRYSIFIGGFFFSFREGRPGWYDKWLNCKGQKRHSCFRYIEIHDTDTSFAVERSVPFRAVTRLIVRTRDVRTLRWPMVL